MRFLYIYCASLYMLVICVRQKNEKSSEKTTYDNASHLESRLHNFRSPSILPLESKKALRAIKHFNLSKPSSRKDVSRSGNCRVFHARFLTSNSRSQSGRASAPAFDHLHRTTRPHLNWPTMSVWTGY